MDGNGRWAINQNLDRIDGHKAGVRVVKKIVKHSVKLGVKYLTLYTLSKENYNRPKSEILYLFKLFTNTLDSELSLLIDNDVNFSVIGDLKKIDKVVLYKLKNVEKLTFNNSTLFLNLAIGYSSRNEIKNAMEQMIAKNIDVINEETISQNLMTKSIPDPDLLIRTGGEFRVSNFLLWQIAYTELFFLKVLWPDFDESHLDNAILEYNKRERRFGKTSEQIND
jgi:undecaprenyl diphosphate synthase